MSKPTDPPEEIRDLIDAYCNDLIDDEGLRRLEAALLASEEARREFVAYFDLHTELQFAIRAKRAANGVLEWVASGKVPPISQDRRRSARHHRGVGGWVRGLPR